MRYKKRHKPFYKQFLRLRENIQDRSKLFTFKKKKWQKIHRNLKDQLKFFKRFKVVDQFQLPASRFASRGNSFQRKFQNNLRERKLFSLFYGGLKKNYLKRSILKSVKTKNYVNRNLVDYRYAVLKKFETRLDTVLYRANFTSSIQESFQLILHGHVFVNGRSVKVKSYNLQTNDLIEIAHNEKSRALVRKTLEESRVLIEKKKNMKYLDLDILESRVSAKKSIGKLWLMPPKHLLVNYRTLQILFVYPSDANLRPVFNHYLNLDSVIANIRKG